MVNWNLVFFYASLIGSILVLLYLCYRFFYKRYTVESNIPNGASFSVRVTRVGDGDGFKAIHKPMLRSTRIFGKQGVVKKELPTLSFRLAGIDAPEIRAFGKPEQPHARESKVFLSYLVLYKKIKVKVVGHDHYGRLIVVAYVGTWLFRKCVNLMLVETGMACVYVGANAMYGGYKETMLSMQKHAQRRRLGMWTNRNAITPMEHKKMYRKI
ncbi:LCL3 [Enterospora canceri]|uniref:LCL3 n=1 Tax=Enterospora canceri TaxID=1081671 RepID=A0A1Y1S960_9MICR|nr:LCL3 [Enterospora canceri]